MTPDYLVSFDTGLLPAEEVDYLVVGGGIAGLRAGLELKDFNTVLICKNGLNETTTYNAQGGIAVAISTGDTPETHMADTMQAGAGLNNQAAVEVLVQEGVARVKELISWGMEFDRVEGKMHFTREGGHSRNRILHADGDATGRKVAEFLHKTVSDCRNLKVRRDCFLVDLISHQDCVYGALILDSAKNSLFVVWAKAVVLASGGAGQVYQETTNPLSITGDGQAAAYRKGAQLVDLEFFQFHPTTFYLAGAPRFLISEAVRGEGGILRNSSGDRFMTDYHSQGELAPRDVVARAILDQMKKTGASCVYLDLAGVSPALIKRRFPNIHEFCRTYGFNLAKDLIPVRPSAHYFMGGVKTDLWGETNLQNLYACGEVACNGLHGANRLASNSLLEGLVFSSRAGLRIKEKNLSRTHAPKAKYRFPQKADILIDREDLKRSIKALMWRNVGIERNQEMLSYAKDKFENWEKYAFLKEFHEASGFESQNMLVLAQLMAKAALLREESRGTHYRTDFQKTDDQHWKKQIVLTREDEA